MKIIWRKKEYKLIDYVENNFPLHINKYNEDDHILHSHDFIELVIVESGKGVHYTGNFSNTIVAGDVLVIPQGIKHGYRDSEMLEIINIMFDISLLNSIADDLKHIPGFHSLFLLSSTQEQKMINKNGFLSLAPNEILMVKQLSSRIIREQREKSFGYRSVCTLTLMDLIVFLSRKSSEHNFKTQTGNLSEVLSYMEKNYPNNITLEQLSRMLNLSPRSFQRIFTAHMGVSPFQYLINLRIQHAKKLLKETNLSINEIAYMTGFGDSAYFSRQFKKIFLSSPRNIRNLIKNTDGHLRPAHGNIE